MDLYIFKNLLYFKRKYNECFQVVLNCFLSKYSKKGIFDDRDPGVLKRFSKSIAIIVSSKGVDQEDCGDDINDEYECNSITVKARLKQILIESLSSDANKILNQNESLVLKNVLLNDQIELFSNPRRELALLNKTEQKRILDVIEQRLVFIPKSEAKIRARIDRTHIPKLNVYIAQTFARIEAQINDTFLGVNGVVSRVSAFINNVTQQAPNENALQTLIGLMGFLNSDKISFDTFESILKNVTNGLALREVNNLRDQKHLLDFFIGLLPDEFKLNESVLCINKRNWLSVTIVAALYRHIDTSKIYEFIATQYKLFEKEYQSQLDKHFTDYLIK
jgi:hypothetical protein